MYVVSVDLAAQERVDVPVCTRGCFKAFLAVGVTCVDGNFQSQ